MRESASEGMAGLRAAAAAAHGLHDGREAGGGLLDGGEDAALDPVRHPVPEGLRRARRRLCSKEGRYVRE